MSHKTNPLDDPTAQRFINDPRTWPCDINLKTVPRCGVDYWAQGGTDGIPDTPYRERHDRP